jgi:type 1 glutamine amidotransferase
VALFSVLTWLVAQGSGDLGYAEALDIPRVLFLTHSAGFVHDVVRRPAPDVLAPAEALFSSFSSGRFALDCSQDCATISREVLARYDAVVFMTTGELLISAENRAALVEWVADGHGFVGIHCATDTLYEDPGYQAMIGGTFDGHPWADEEVRVRVEDAQHPAVKHLAPSFGIVDEIYQFKNFRRHPVHVLLSLEPGGFDAAKGKRADGDYAIAWARAWGQGRLFYTALGHRLEVWKDERFQRQLLEGVAWAIDGPDARCIAPGTARVLVTPEGTAAPGAWLHVDGRDVAWKTVDGGLEVVSGTGDLVSKEAFGDALLHVEFRCPSMPEATGQARANSGVYVQGRYELQVLDSYGLALGLGDCGSLYGVKIADVNACRPPGQWQSYDIELTAPVLDANGARTSKARMSAWLNGRPIHVDVELDGPTAGGMPGEVAQGPVRLQDHGDAVRYRNVWVLAR